VGQGSSPFGMRMREKKAPQVGARDQTPGSEGGSLQSGPLSLREKDWVLNSWV
jgi:hypothetical protein